MSNDFILVYDEHKRLALRRRSEVASAPVAPVPVAPTAAPTPRAAPAAAPTPAPRARR